MIQENSVKEKENGLEIIADEENRIQTYEKRWGAEFLQKRLFEEERLRTGNLPIRFFAHEIEETRYFFKWIKRGLQGIRLYPRGVRNALDFQLRHYDFFLSSLPREFEPLTILQLSDLHIDAYPEFRKHLQQRLETLSYDLVVVTGDYSFELKKDSVISAHKELAELFPSLHCRYGVYGILGNHDSVEIVPFLESLGVQMLVNEQVKIETPSGALWIAGVDDPHHFQLSDLDKALKEIPPTDPILLLAHSPEIIPQAYQSGVDLYLTGHTHGGQFCLPGGRSLFVNARCERQYTRGLWNYREMQGYTTTGTGSSGIFARYNCPPEFCLHTLRPKLEPVSGDLS